ncbi:hypothetical protein [Chitinophaga sp. S165]|uniref:hypothetical protein n=1 Tax=Chitinophaga sp. S165 TaxID=2135462 RepID=UPI000D70CE39|nr:hypothetical protein [Chitinophaga sp. S165]
MVDTEDARYRKEDTADSEGMWYHTVDRVVVGKYHAVGKVYAGKYRVVGMGMNHAVDAGKCHVADEEMNREADVLNHMEGMGYCHEEDYP